jgi:hypothetical protein
MAGLPNEDAGREIFQNTGDVMVTSRYSIAFIFLLSVFLSLGIALYTTQSETPSLPVIATAVAPAQAPSTTLEELRSFSWSIGRELVITYLVALTEITSNNRDIAVVRA